MSTLTHESMTNHHVGGVLAQLSETFHIWRQRFPTGKPEQITSFATEEEGIALAPDGRSLISSVGTEQSTVWLHDPHGDRQLTSEGYAYTPSVSPDGSKVYYLVRDGSSRAFVGGELWVADTASTHQEKVLPGFLITRYDISLDGKRVVFAAIDAGGKSSLWLVRLDRRASPLQLTSDEAARPFFGSNGAILFVGKEGDFGKDIGLDNECAYRIIKQVGNYGEIFDRHVGAGSRLNIPRGRNNLYTQGGLHYAPPFR